ncbi:transposase [uncultured Nitrospira sp.]|uniref:transposase n=1 Tax=uncultured Nitrospira sp. TaxID=157176 RepID=UPI0031400728
MSTPSLLGFVDLTTRYEGPQSAGRSLRTTRASGPLRSPRLALAKSFDAICKFKVFVLQVLYNLSNDQTEYQIRDRLSFMRFLVLDPAQYIPDAQTIWLFRETLAQADVVEALF